jgi:hypothetical protein
MKFIWSIGLLLILLGLYTVSCTKDYLGPDDIAGKEITPDQRLEVLTACEDKLASLQGKTPDESQQELVGWLKSRPEFVAAGYSAESKNVWAVFADGRLLMMVNNRPAPPYGERSGRTTAESPVISASGARVSELPNPKRVLLFNGMGTHFIDPTSGISNIFAAAKTGYKVEGKKATIDELKAVGEDVAVFYISTHGGEVDLKDSIRVNGKGVPMHASGLWTTESKSLAGETRYQSDLDSHLMGYMVATNDEPSKGQVTIETHYAITDAFVKQYMKFGENALLYIGACSSFKKNDDGDQFAATFINKAVNAKATYVGWSAPTRDSDCYKAAKFLFDRLLGANSVSLNANLGIPKEDPDQRPFDIDAVMKDMVSKSLVFSTTGNGNTSVLHHVSTVGPDNRAILAPSISYLEIDELTSELTIYGIFGSDPGDAQREVTVNGTKVPVNDWGQNEISCIIPAKGAGAAGDVVVSVRGNKSNPVPLTEWYIPFTWLEKGPIYNRQIEIVLHLRADVHRYRRTPGEKTPKRIDKGDVVPSHPFGKGSKATYKASGTCSYVCPCNPGQFTTTNTVVGPPEISIPYIVDGTSATNSFFAVYGWDNDRKVLSLFASGSNFSGYQNRVVSGGCTGGGSTTVNEPFPIAFLVSEGPSEIVLELPLTNPDAFDFSIRQGQRSMGGIAIEHCVCQGSPDVPITLSWKTTTPAFAPTAKTAARVEATTPN